MDKLGPVNLEVLLNSPEVLKASEEMKAAILGMMASAETSSEKAADGIADSFSKGAKEIEAAADKLDKAINNPGKGGAIAVNPEENKILDEKTRLLQSVSDEYRGVLDAGLSAYDQLTPEARTMIIQLNDMDHELRTVSSAQMDLNKRFDMGTVDAQQYTQALAGLSVREAELRRGIQETSRNLQGQGQALAAARPQWNGLGNSINQISRELPAFTYSMQTGFMAISNNIPMLADEVGRLKKENEALVASGKKGIPVWKQVVTSLFSWQTALSLGVTLLTVYGKEIGEWIQGLFKGGEAAREATLKTEAFNKAIESTDYSKAISQVNELEANINAAKEGLLSKEEVLRTYNEGIGKTTGSLETFNELEQWQMDNADKYIQYMFKKAEAQALLQLAVDKTIEAQKKSVNGPGFEDYVAGAFQAAGTGSWMNLMTYAQANSMESSAEDKLMSKRYLEMFQEAQKDVQEYAKANGFDFLELGDDKESQKKITDSRQQLLDKIAALDREYARKSFTKDDEEVQALQDKFARVRELVERFNSDPKNKANRISVSGLDTGESKAVGDLLFRQETDMMATEIAKQKKLFTEFEEYRAKFGTEKAKEAYGDQLGEYESYMDYLRTLIDKNQSTYAAVATGTAIGTQTERHKILEAAAEAENNAQKVRNQEAQAEYQSHANKMLARQQEYLRRRKELEASLTAEELAIMDERFDEETQKLNAAETRKTESYKRVMGEIRDITVKGARELLVEAEALLEKEKDNGEERIKIEKRIAELKKMISRGSLESIYQISQALGALGTSIENLGNSVDSAGLAQIGGLMSGLASGAGELLTALDSESTSTDRWAAGIASAVKLIDIVASSARQRKQAEEEYYRSLIGFQHEYNLSLNEQIRLQNQLGESVFLKDFEGRIKDGLNALKDANEEYQNALDGLSGGQAKSGQKNGIDWKAVGQGAASGAAIGAVAGGGVFSWLTTGIGAIGGALVGLFGGLKKKDTFVPLLQEYGELIEVGEDGVERLNRELAETLIAQNLVDDSTKQLIQNVIDWEEAMESARQQIRDVVSELAGSLSTDMRNSLVEAFVAGEDAAVAMGKTVEKVLEDIIGQVVFNRVFAEAFQSLEDQMAESMDVGGDNNWVDDFQRFFEASKGLSDQWDQAMKDAQAQAAAAGFNIFNPDSATNKQEGLKGGFERLTEQTGSELAGIARSSFDINKRHYQLDEGRLALEQQHYQATLEGLNYWAAIERNTGATVEQLELAVVELKSIVKNTKPGQSAYDLGEG